MESYSHRICFNLSKHLSWITEFLNNQLFRSVNSHLSTINNYIMKAQCNHVTIWYAKSELIHDDMSFIPKLSIHNKLVNQKAPKD